METGIDHSVSVMRMKELADLTGMHLPNLSTHFKAGTAREVRRTGNRVTGVMPNAVESLLKTRGFSQIYRPSVTITNSQCGGIGKTTTTINFAFSFARMSNRDDYPVLIMDADTQASTTLQLLGTQRTGNFPVLIDYIEGRVKSLKEIAIELDKNIFLLPGSLNNSYLEKHVSNPRSIKEVGSKIIAQAFKDFSIGGRLKIFIDSPPALSAITHTLLFGANALGDEYDKALCLPMRPDNIAIEGCAIALTELEEMLEDFKEPLNLKIVPFLNRYVTRGQESINSMKEILKHPIISKYDLAPVVIKESTEISKRINRNKHVYSAKEYKTTPVAQEYQELMLYVMGWSGGE